MSCRWWTEVLAEDGIGQAVSAGRSHGLLRLMERGHAAGDHDEDGQAPLHVAARHGRLDCTKILLANGALISARTRDKLLNGVILTHL